MVGNGKGTLHSGTAGFRSVSHFIPTSTPEKGLMIAEYRDTDCIDGLADIWKVRENMDGGRKVEERWKKGERREVLPLHR